MNIFIAFANEDRDVRDKLIRQMNLVKDRYAWNIWSAKEIKAGEYWDEEIRQRLQASEVIILLLSTDFFNSDYIIQKELPEVVEKHKKGNCQIIPVIARLCHWKETTFGEYMAMGDIQALPVGERPIVSRGSWDNEDQPYFETVQGIKESILSFNLKKSGKKPVSTSKDTTASQAKADPKPAVKTPGPSVQPKPATKKTTPVRTVSSPPTQPKSGIQLPVSLFPLYGVTLGKTTVEEMKLMGGVQTDDINDRTGKPYNCLVKNKMDFWYDEHFVNHIYLVHSNPMPLPWKALGFDWKLSYNGWKNLFSSLGYELLPAKAPVIAEFQGHPSFSARILAKYQMGKIIYKLELDFNYSTGTTVLDEGTLYYLRVTAEPA